MSLSDIAANTCFALGIFKFEETKEASSFSDGSFNVKRNLDTITTSFKTNQTDNVIVSTWPTFCIFDIPIKSADENGDESFRITRVTVFLSNTLNYSDGQANKKVTKDADLKNTIKRLTGQTDETTYDEIQKILYWNPTLPVPYYSTDYNTSWYKFVGEQLATLVESEQSRKELFETLDRLSQRNRYILVPHETTPSFKSATATRPHIASLADDTWVQAIAEDKNLSFNHYSLFADELAVVGQVFLNRFTTIFNIPVISAEGAGGNALSPRDVSQAVEEKIESVKKSGGEATMTDSNGIAWINADKFKDAVGGNWGTLVQNVHNDNESAEYAIVVVKRDPKPKQ